MEGDTLIPHKQGSMTQIRKAVVEDVRTVRIDVSERILLLGTILASAWIVVSYLTH